MATPEDILTKKIMAIYAQAAKEVKQKTAEFWNAHKRIAAQMLADVQSGKITQADYKKWLRGQVFTGERWKQKLDDITKVYVDADKKAREIISGTTKNVFVDMANRTAYDMEKELRGGVSFDLYDGKTVERLLKDNPKMLPEWKIDEPKDYIWNEKRVQNAVTQGIVQGESIADIGKRLTSELATSNGSKMDMFARTAINGAQNAGRMDRLHEAEEMGIEVRKKWLATLDQRTRDTHQALDGQEQPIDEPFVVDGMKIDYPGDPFAPPELVYNCRCTLTYVYPKYQHLQHNHERRDQLNDKNIENMTYYEWVGLASKNDRKQETPKLTNAPRHAEFTPAKTIQEAEEQARQYVSSTLGTISYKGIDLEYANTCNRVLGDMSATFDVDKLGSIQQMNMRSKVFKGSTAEAAYRWGGIGGDLFINPTYYKNTALFNSHKAEIDKLMETVLSNGDVLKKNATGEKAEYIDAILNTKRQCVSQSYNFAEGTFVHECGHMMDDKVFQRQMRDAFGGTIKYSDNLAESRHKYGVNISGYAVANNREYIAESFTAWWYGEGDKIDPTIRTIFEGAVKR